jgi:hypothetical protein
MDFRSDNLLFFVNSLRPRIFAIKQFFILPPSKLYRYNNKRAIPLVTK